jgi:hypothetical protein
MNAETGRGTATGRRGPIHVVGARMVAAGRLSIRRNWCIFCPQADSDVK